MKTYGEIKEALKDRRDDYELEAEYGVAGGLQLLIEEMTLSAHITRQDEKFWDFRPEQLVWSQFVFNASRLAEEDIDFYWDRIALIAYECAED